MNLTRTPVRRRPWQRKTSPPPETNYSVWSLILKSTMYVVIHMWHYHSLVDGLGRGGWGKKASRRLLWRPAHISSGIFIFIYFFLHTTNLQQPTTRRSGGGGSGASPLSFSLSLTLSLSLSTCLHQGGRGKEGEKERKSPWIFDWNCWRILKGEGREGAFTRSFDFTSHQEKSPTNPPPPSSSSMIAWTFMYSIGGRLPRSFVVDFFFFFFCFLLFPGGSWQKKINK